MGDTGVDVLAADLKGIGWFDESYGRGMNNVLIGVARRRILRELMQYLSFRNKKKNDICLIFCRDILLLHLTSA